MNQLPKDPILLLSFLNTQLRDHYETLEELCSSYMVEKQETLEKMEAINYHYDAGQNQFK